jgi:hypothetical protein
MIHLHIVGPEALESYTPNFLLEFAKMGVKPLLPFIERNLISSHDASSYIC